jgi:hypothetical protein
MLQERRPQLKYQDPAPEVRPLADDIHKVSSAALGGPYNALLRSPDMARRCFELLDDLRFQISVEKRLNEFAILIQARVASAQHEWWAHEPIARKAGLSDALMRELQQCRRPAAMREDENLGYDYCVAAHAQPPVAGRAVAAGGRRPGRAAGDRPDRAVRDLRDGVDAAERDPGRPSERRGRTARSAGAGSASHLCGLMMMNALNVKLNEIPHKGTGPALTDLMGGVKAN